MPNPYYEGERGERIRKAIEGIESWCKRRNPQGFQNDIQEFTKHQIPLLTPKNKMCPTWLANQPPQHLAYVLDGMWREWKPARVRWGDIIHALRERFPSAESAEA